ncbi:5-oxoprolinase subunit PxpA [Mesorhizobium sp. B4-1-1]|uniref:5-oxoprolinase subunit PxpA n=1 Tax=Mesorhizobium sp. B4-1-1 TaxID=2589890 RepID=UPI0011277C28|nr:5-oxoprolinase subunit PxpA [Mesorhizobium sp. B4-1-1]TPI13848.1 5-oxoprolinase subunit PxpA [Mesorhizobium sp. B4-1-1]
MVVSLNCDMGESYGHWRFGDDAGIMPSVDCANIACGFHAGDPMTMLRTVELALREGKRIGAHPSLPDREGFGRREMRLSPDELRSAFIYQIGALAGFARAAGTSLNHVKPHGTIYGMAARDIALATAMAEAAKTFDLPLFGMAGTLHEQAATAVGAQFVGEFFADLTYSAAGELIIPRSHSAVDIAKAAARLERALRERKVEAVDGTVLDISFQTVCIHSDPPNARDVAAAMRRVLDAVQR